MEGASVVEVVTFKLKAGVSDEEFIKAAAESNVVVIQAKGYLNRQLLHNADGQWVDIIWWTSHQDFHNANEMLMANLAFQKFGGAIDEATMALHLLSPVQIK